MHESASTSRYATFLVLLHHDLLLLQHDLVLLHYDLIKTNNRRIGEKRKIKIGILTSDILFLTLLQSCGKYEIFDEKSCRLSCFI